MAGRNDFGVLHSSFYSDERAQRAADLYVEKGFVSKAFAAGAVAGHIAQLGLWAMLRTDDGVLPGDAVAAVKDATRIEDRDVCRTIVAMLREAELLRPAEGGLYLVGFRDCYKPILSRREQNREAAENSRKKKASATSQHDVTLTGTQEVSNTSALSQRDVSVTEPVAPRHADVSTTSAPTEPFRAVPSRAVPGRADPPRAVPSVADAPNGHVNGGGVSTSSTHGEGNGTTPDRLSPEDEAVAVKIIQLLRKSDVEIDRHAAEKAFTAMRDRKATPAQVRAFADDFTVRFVKEVTEVRRPFAMARNGREKDGQR